MPEDAITGRLTSEQLDALWDLQTIEDREALEATRFEDHCKFQTIMEMIEDSVKRRGDAPAISFQLRGAMNSLTHTISYKELWERSIAFANALHARGVQPGETIALVMPNTPETVIAILGAQMIGTVMTINPLLEPEAIAHIIEEGGAKVVVSLKSFIKSPVAPTVARALRLTPHVRELIQLDLMVYIPTMLRPMIGLMRPKAPKIPSRIKVSDIRKLIRRAPKDKLTFTREIGPDTIASYFHTGGTTGSPKLAMHTHKGVIANAWTMSKLILDENDVALVCLPLFHVFGTYVLVFGPLAAGGHVVLATPSGFRGDGVVENFWKLIERYKATLTACVPTIFATIEARPVDADVSSLKYLFSGSAPLPVPLYMRFEENTGVQIIEGYGMTECTCISSCSPPWIDERRIGSVGVSMLWMEARICHFDANGDYVRTCDPNEIGEICFNGVSLFAGYKDPEKNKGVFFEIPGTEGRWLRTGDLGRKDDETVIWITGRAKDVIIRGGHNIDPGLIEEALAAHPAVQLSGAVGQPDARAGELPCAYVELSKGAAATTEELLEYCREHVNERAACPVHIEIVDQMPVTTIEKIFKPALRKMAIQRVFGEALEKVGLQAKINVVDDKERGMIAELTPIGPFDEAKAQEALGGFDRPWRLAA